MVSKKRIINKHHTSYGNPETGDPEVIVKVYKGEHLIITRLGWTKAPPSKAFLVLLKEYIAKHENDAVDLEE